MPTKLEPLNINSTYVVFDNNGAAIPMEVNSTFWQNLKDQFGDFSGKTLVSCFGFDKDWGSWERHPEGDEFVCLLSGEVELLMEQDGAISTTRLTTPGAFVLVPRGVWHTAKVRSPSSMLFITPGEGTQNKSV